MSESLIAKRCSKPWRSRQSALVDNVILSPPVLEKSVGYDESDLPRPEVGQEAVVGVNTRGLIPINTLRLKPDSVSQFQIFRKPRQVSSSLLFHRELLFTTTTTVNAIIGFGPRARTSANRVFSPMHKKASMKNHVRKVLRTPMMWASICGLPSLVTR